MNARSAAGMFESRSQIPHTRTYKRNIMVICIGYHALKIDEIYQAEHDNVF